jgi:hypothetical protein
MRDGKEVVKYYVGSEVKSRLEKVKPDVEIAIWKARIEERERIDRDSSATAI